MFTHNQLAEIDTVLRELEYLPGEIAESLGMTESEFHRHLNESGYVTFIYRGLRPRPFQPADEPHDKQKSARCSST